MRTISYQNFNYILKNNHTGTTVVQNCSMPPYGMVSNRTLMQNSAQGATPPQSYIYNFGARFSNTVSNHNAIKNYAVPFLGMQIKSKKKDDDSIYAIDAYKNFKKYDNAYEAAKAFNVSVSSILRCAGGDCDSVGDFMFAYSKDVEETDRNGKPTPDKLIINLASEVLCLLAAFKTVPLSIEEATELKVKSKTVKEKKIDNTAKPGKRIDAAVYAIDKNGRYMKFAKVQELLDSLDISKASVYKCLRKEKDNINGIVFCYDFDVETINEEGDIVPNNRLIKQQIKSLKNIDTYATIDLLLLRKQGGKISDCNNTSGKTVSGILGSIPDEDLSSVQLRYLQKPFYVVDKDKNYRKFYLQKYVADALGLYKDKISDCLQGRIKSIKGYSFIYANKVEKADKDGNVTVDEDKLFGKDTSDSGFYLVDKDGKYKKYETVEEAHRDLNISYNYILSCILGRHDKTSGYTFVRAADLEIINEDGTISINENKLQESRNILIKGAVYLVDSEGKYKRYKTRVEAAEAIGVSPQDISTVTIGRKKRTHGYVAINASEVETISDDGKIKTDINKIKEIYDASKEIRTIDVSENGFYAIDKSAKYQKFYDITQSQKELGIPYMRILNCLLGFDKMAKGYVFALGEDIDIKKEDGTCEADVTKIVEKAAYFESKAIYAIEKSGKCTRFSSQTEASNALGIPLVNISRCINKVIKETYGYTFLTAKEVEIKNGDDKIIPDEDLIQERVFYLNRNAVYAIDKEGKCQRFEDRDAAEKALNVKKANIAGCLNGRHKMSHGFIFAFPWEIEKRQNDGTYVPDEEKIKALTGKIFQRKSN